MNGVNWSCPYCDILQTLTTPRVATINGVFDQMEGVDGPLGISARSFVCSNPKCTRTSVNVAIVGYHKYGSSNYAPLSDPPILISRQLKPEGSSKPFPEYIPKAIRDDYNEACLIRELSPKASATLARRCLQGMIRDFVKPDTKSDKLFAEIQALEKAIKDGTAPRGVSEDSIAALTAVRKIGNIGAHMEADVDVIVDVDPQEAQILIELIESLLQDWYVERHKRSERFAATVALGAQKAQELKDAQAGQLAITDQNTKPD